MQFTKIFLKILFFTLPLVHGKLLESIGIPLSLEISGNFEFFKSQYFQIFLSIIFIIFTLESIIGKKNPFKHISFGEGVFFVFFIGLFCIITFTSISPLNSFWGDSEKGHTTLLFFSLAGLFFLLRSFSHSDISKFLLWGIYGAVLSCCIALKELLLPSFEYGPLGDRALGTFGHPNYLAGYILLCFGYMWYVKISFRKTLLSLFAISIFFSKSFVALGILSVFYSRHIILYTLKKYSQRAQNTVSGFFLLFFLGASFIFSLVYVPEKLHSFLSRFSLWQSSLEILFSNPKIFLGGIGPESLPFYFESFKTPSLYIFENFGYTADRAHNIFLDVWLTSGFFGLLFFCSTIVFLYKKYPHKKLRTPLLFFVFYGLFHYFSLVSFVFCIALIAKEKAKENIKNTLIKTKIYPLYILFFVPLFLSIFLGGFMSIQHLRGESLYARGESDRAWNIFQEYRYALGKNSPEDALKIIPSSSQLIIKYYLEQRQDIQKNCHLLLTYTPSAENFFFCGDIFWNSGDKVQAKKYYTLGIQKLPDLWNHNSPYRDNYIVKKTISGNRFFSEKFSSLREVLQKLEIPIESIQ